MSDHEPSLPADMRAQAAVLSSIMGDVDMLASLPSLQVGQFYGERDQLIFAAMRACFDRRQPPDLIHVHAELKRREQLDLIGGYAYLHSLAEAAPSIYRAPQYAKIVGDHAKKRALITTGGRVAAYGYDPGLTADEAIAKAQQDLDLVDSTIAEDMHGAQAMVKSWYESRLTPRPDMGRGASTGLAGLDDYLRPSIRGGKLIVIAGYTGTGKSTLSAVIRRALLAQGWQNLTFTGEMPKDEILDRDATALGGFTMDYVTSLADRMAEGHTNPPSDEELREFNDVATELELMGTYTDEYGDQHDRFYVIDKRRTMREIERRALYLRHRNPQPLCVVIDHLGLVAHPHGAKGTYEIVSENARQAKQLAMETDSLVIMPVQLNRDAARLQQEDREPELDMLRDSGEIEQSADAVIMLKHSTEFVNALAACKTQHERERVKGIVHAYLRKHRNGAKGMCNLMADFAHYDMKG